MDIAMYYVVGGLIVVFGLFELARQIKNRKAKEAARKAKKPPGKSEPLPPTKEL